MPTLTIPEISNIQEVISQNNLERKISTGSIPPPIDQEENGGGRREEIYYLTLFYKDASKNGCACTGLELFKNELWIPFNAFLNMAIVYNPSFVSSDSDSEFDSDNQKLDSLSDEEIFKLCKEQRSKPSSEDSGRKMLDYLGVYLSRISGYHSPKEELSAIKTVLASGENLIFYYNPRFYNPESNGSNDFETNKAEFLKRNAIDIQKPMSELFSRKSNHCYPKQGFYSLMLMLEKESDIGVTGFGQRLS